MKPRVTAIVPTLGLSPWLVLCLEALRRGDDGIRILVVAQGGRQTPAAARAALAAASELADRILHLPANVGFAAANNHALRQAEGELVAMVNDDVVVDPDWCRTLVAALDEAPETAAVQGVNLMLDAPELADGCGLAWNGSWQAIQIGRGQPAPPVTTPPAEIFGVSATAAIYRREALRAVSGAEGRVFDPDLFAFYEDVDLACRLRAAGYRALLVPAARAEHAGSVTGGRLPLAGGPLIYGNRYLVLARLLGRSLWLRLPRIWLRDAIDLGHALSRGRLGAAAAIGAGWGRALRRGHRYVHAGQPALPLAELHGGRTS